MKEMRGKAYGRILKLTTAFVSRADASRITIWLYPQGGSRTALSDAKADMSWCNMNMYPWKILWVFGVVEKRPALPYTLSQHIISVVISALVIIHKPSQKKLIDNATSKLQQFKQRLNRNFVVAVATCTVKRNWLGFFNGSEINKHR